MGKKCSEDEFLFDEKFAVSLIDDKLYITYRIDDRQYFCIFYLETRRFVTGLGFGKNDKSVLPEWWKKTAFHWKEIGK